MKNKRMPHAATSKAQEHRSRGGRQIARIKTLQPASRKSKSNGQPISSALPSPIPAPAPPVKLPVVPLMPANIPVITYFNQDAQKWLRTGETVYITMQGTPGSQATFRIGTLTGNIAMRESSPGQYLGSWVVPMGKNLSTSPFTVVGELRANGKTADPMPASHPLQIDAQPPVVANATPQETTSATPPIACDLRDEGSGIDIASLHLRVNGRDVTGSAQVTADHILYTPMSALSAGEQTVELEVSDRAGNKTMQSWRFMVKL